MSTIYSPLYFERGTQGALGQHSQIVLSGLGLQIPLVGITHPRNTRKHTKDIGSQPVITKDNVEITVDDVRWMCRIVDEEGIKCTFCNIDNWKQAAIELAMTNLCQQFGELSPSESLLARETIAAHLQRMLNAFVVQWGLTVSQPVDTPSNGNGHDRQGKR